MNFLVNIDVPDLQRAVDFYTAALGLKVARRLGSAGVELIGSSAPIWLLAKEGGSAATPANAGSRTYDRHWTPVHLDFEVDDIDGAVRSAVAAGASLEAPISAHPWGKLALMADPFGHGFCFVVFLGRGYDELVERGG